MWTSRSLVEELPNVLWAYQTTPKRSTGETLFSLTYGAKTVIPVEMNLCSAQVARFDPAQNNELMVECLDWLDECREAAIIQLAEYQQKLAKWYNRDVKAKEFSAEGLVLRKAVGNMRDANVGKLAQAWEGPYRDTAIAGAGAYYLEDLNERPLPWPWNVHNLKKFYHWLLVRGSVNPNMYISLANMMTMLLVAVVFDFIITYLVLPANKYRGS